MVMVNECTYGVKQWPENVGQTDASRGNGKRTIYGEPNENEMEFSGLLFEKHINIDLESFWARMHLTVDHLVVNRW
jgi:hypothetical protein